MLIEKQNLVLIQNLGFNVEKIISYWLIISTAVKESLSIKNH